MRWSLILSTSLTVLSTLSVALVIPLSESSVDLERRAGDNAKTSSKTYRKESENHDYVYKFDQTGSVSREKLKLTDRPAHGRKIIMIPKTDADHVFEHQMFNSHLKSQNLEYNKLDPKLQQKAKGIINGAKNMAPVPRQYNRGKGQTIKHGLKGNALSVPNKGRDEYTLLSYKTARNTAKKLDKAFKDSGHDFKGETFHKTLRNTMNNAKIMDPNDPSPKSSDHGSSKASDGSSKASSSKASSDHGSAKASSDHGSDKASSDHASSKASSDHGSDKASSDHGSDKASSDKASSDHGSVKASPIQSPRRNPFILPVRSKPKVVMQPLALRRSSRLQAAASGSNAQGT